MIRTLTFTIFTAGALFAAQSGANPTFATPEEARDALVQAAAKGIDSARAFFGTAAGEIVRTGDDVEDRNLLEKFNREAAVKAELDVDPNDPERKIIRLGDEGWPFSIPIARKNGRWYYDLVEGKAEIRRRIIGYNELDAIDVCRGYVEAQQMYAEMDPAKAGVPQYAGRIISSQGKKDGLYWPGDDSPVAAGFAKAVAEGYQPSAAGPKPYHGYFYKVLTAQGPDAPGGAQDYVVHGLMLGGFALVAWPAEYGNSGVKSFIVSHDGVVYEKDLGRSTTVLAKAITKFNPDKTWTALPDDDEP
jgi:hypothetical protein